MIRRLSVVVPVLNAGRTLPQCLGALARLDPAPAEIILVDNGSTDESLHLARAFARGHAGVRVLTEAQRGAAAARNAGIRAATGDAVAFTDADCAPAPNWLQHLREPFADPSVGGVAGRVLPAPARGTLELFSALYTLQLPDRPARHVRWTPRTGGFPTANLAVRRDLLAELGGFDASLVIYGEDYDLCARLYARGAAVAYTPEARVSHHHRTTLGAMLRQAFGFGRSHAFLLRRHARHGLWLELPRRTIEWPACPRPAWMDLASADKKLLAMLALALVVPPAAVLPPLYLAWLAVAASRRARQVGARVGVGGALGLGGLLVLKSLAMTAGRWRGSLKYGAVCL